LSIPHNSIYADSEGEMVERVGGRAIASPQLLESELVRATARHQAGVPYAYLHCEIDGLSEIVASHGHDQADRLVREVSLRLTDGLRDDDVIAHRAMGVYAVLAANTDTFGARLLAQALAEVVEGIVELPDSPVWPAILVGVATTVGGIGPAELPRAAAAALRRAMSLDPGAVPPPSHHPAGLEQTMNLRYLPIVRLATSQVVGAEAVLRWDRAGLGRWVLRRACLDALRWPADQVVSVNLSPAQLTDDLVIDVQEALRASLLTPDRLWLEITEPDADTDLDAVVRVLRRVTALGVSVALDDFGSGDRAMSRIRDLPLRGVKIGRPYVSLLDKSRDDIATGVTLARVAATLDVTMGAEGIETVEQAQRLRRLGCQYGQGRLWSGPLFADDFAARITEIERTPPSPVCPEPPSSGQIPKPDAAVMAQILQLHRRGASPACIAAALNQEHIDAPAGPRWRCCAIAHLIADRGRDRRAVGATHLSQLAQ
jgi:EAL domain-containing protein (putative c-di-GMP-specific phosphodiesterase class I)